MFANALTQRDDCGWDEPYDVQLMHFFLKYMTIKKYIEKFQVLESRSNSLQIWCERFTSHI